MRYTGPILEFISHTKRIKCVEIADPLLNRHVLPLGLVQCGC